MKRMSLLLTTTVLVGCEACYIQPSLPFIAVPNTQEIHEFHVDFLAARAMWMTFLASVEEKEEMGLCLTGELEWIARDEFVDTTHTESRHLRLSVTGGYPAEADSASAVALWFSNDPCREDALGRGHTHIVPSPFSHSPSDQDIQSLWYDRKLYFLVVIWGVGETEGVPIVGTTWRFKHGYQFEWIIPTRRGREETNR